MKKKSVERRYVLIGVCFLLPAVVASLVFMAYPLSLIHIFAELYRLG